MGASASGRDRQRHVRNFFEIFFEHATLLLFPRAVRDALRPYAHRMLMGAINPMECPIHRYMLLSSDVILGDEAHRMGIVQKVNEIGGPPLSVTVVLVQFYHVGHRG